MVTESSIAIIIQRTFFRSDNAHQKPTARSLIAELLGRLAAAVRSALHPYAPRLVQFLLKSIQDVDIHVQEAGAIALGQICRYSLQEGQVQPVLSSLYRLMANKPTPVQASAARALSCLLSALEPGLLSAHYDIISMVVQRHLYKPSTHSILQRYLFNALTSIPATKASPSSLPNLFRAMTSNLSSGSWQVSQAAAEALQAWADPHCYPVYGPAVIAALQQARFHRIAQVREAVIAALNRWKDLPNPSSSSVVAAAELNSVRNDDQRGEPETQSDAAAAEPVIFEYATESAPSNTKRNFQNKILRQQRLLFDLVEDLCRRVDDGMIHIKARLASLEAITERLQQQEREQRTSG